MKPPLPTAPLALAICWLFLVAACSKDPSANTTPSPPPGPPAPRDSMLPPQPAASANLPPVADAGPDQVVTLPNDSARLSGKGTDADGTIASYHWFITTHDYYKGLIAVAYSTTPEFTVKNLKEGFYDCTLTVTDNGGLSGIDRMVLRVASRECPCYPDPCDPVADPCDPWDY